MNKQQPSRLLQRLAFSALTMPILVALGGIAIYHGWLGSDIITSGDWVPTPAARMLDFWPLPSLWNGSMGTGGADIFGTILYPQYTLYGLMAKLGIGYGLVERLIFMFPAIVVACIGGYVLSFSLFHSRVAAAITGLFLVCNSYIVIIDGGGQYLVGVAYALIPLVLWAFRAALRGNRRYHHILAALFLAIQGTYDLRLTYVTILMLALYVPFIVADIVKWIGSRQALLRLVTLAFLCLIVGLFVNAPWLLPSLFAKGGGSVGPPSLPQGYNGINELQGLSYMLLSNAISLLHPFWPLNPLGHVAPLNPVFFIIPLLVFALLLRASLNRDKQYLFTLSLVSIFFVKGAQQPAPQINEWFFMHIPGFVWFRDPSKFYQPLMVAMALLLGLGVVEGSRWLMGHSPWGIRGKDKSGWLLKTTCGALGILIAVYPALPGVFSGRAGALVLKPVPSDYARINALIDNQSDYFRTLWFPQGTLFQTYSDRHPVLDASAIGSQLFSTRLSSTQYSWLGLPGVENALQALSVKYVILPSAALQDAYAIPNGSQNLGVTFQTILAQARHDLPDFRETVIGTTHVFVNPHVLRQVYIPSRIASVQAGVEGTIPPLTTSATIVPPRSVAPSRMTYDIMPSQLPTIHFRQVSPAQINVSIQGAKQPFILQFLQSYDPNWRAYIMPAHVSPHWWTLRTAQAISQNYHARGDGYANAWWINERGSYTVVLWFWPQELTAIGGILCWLTIIICGGYAMLAWRGNRHEEDVTPKGPRRIMEPVAVAV